MIYMVWAQDENGGIGVDNNLPWNIKAEMDHFRSITLNHNVLMGFKTYASIGKLLKHRKNFVLTSNKTNVISGAIVVHDYKKIIERFGDNDDSDIYIIGGKKVYELFAPYADFLIVSFIPGDYNCDVKINIDMDKFEEMRFENHKEFDVRYYVRRTNN